MNSQFNYATFVELFLKSDQTAESYVVNQFEPPATTEPVATDNVVSPPA
ncbi:hypothetical protein EDC23_0891 [Thiohalophilus thiocyanatoxydans]|uniref:Uncharacterized protein n=1 Tax=Thiohalophilus thiocyanatoxydans TaxID=381308 RepID=A0A4R8INR0_9GAMM|nr:hypothetical protein EDC23_0891 [Thiohalophilus thiocyanatoxydans]